MGKISFKIFSTTDLEVKSFAWLLVQRQEVILLQGLITPNDQVWSSFR